MIKLQINALNRNHESDTHTRERRKLSFVTESQLINAEEIMELGNQHLAAPIVVTGRSKESRLN